MIIEPKHKILIADDDNISVILLTKNLNEFNADILFARNGQEAIEVFIENPDIDLILMDIKMPNLNGYEATKQIKAINPKVKIIAETAFAMADDEKRAKEAGCDAYITKPINADKLKRMVRQMLGK